MESTGRETETQRERRDRLRKIEGQVRGIQRMVEERRPCEDIITQLLAVRTALDKVAAAIVSDHVADCLATLPPERAKAAIGRAVDLLTRV